MILIVIYYLCNLMPGYFPFKWCLDELCNVLQCRTLFISLTVVRYFNIECRHFNIGCSSMLRNFRLLYTLSWVVFLFSSGSPNSPTFVNLYVPPNFLKHVHFLKIISLSSEAIKCHMFPYTWPTLVYWFKTCWKFVLNHIL